MKISIKGLNKADVLAALYNTSRPAGLGFLHYNKEPMTKEQASQIIMESGDFLCFDYLQGRCMKVDISEDEFNPESYDQANGEGRAQTVIEELKQTGKINSVTSQAIHIANTKDAAKVVKEEASSEKDFDIKKGSNIIIMELGFGELATPLKKRIEELNL